MSKLIVNKIEGNEKLISVTEKGVQYECSADFRVYTSGSVVVMLSVSQGLRFQENYKNIEVNSASFNSSKDAAAALIAFVGSGFKQSGGTGNTPTLQEVASVGNTTTIPLNIPAAQADSEAVQFGQLKTTLNGYVKGFGVTEIRVVMEIPAEQKNGVLYILTE